MDDLKLSEKNILEQIEEGKWKQNGFDMEAFTKSIYAECVEEGLVEKRKFEKKKVKKLSIAKIIIFSIIIFFCIYFAVLSNLSKKYPDEYSEKKENVRSYTGMYFWIISTWVCN